MKKMVKEAAKLVGIAVTLSLVILVGVYFYEAQVTAGTPNYVAVTEDYTEASTEATTSKDAQTTEATEATTETTKVTEKATDATTEDTTTEVKSETDKEVEVPATQEATAPTEAATQAPTEAATEAPTAAPVVQATLFTDVTYSDVNGNKTSYATLDDLKASITVSALSDDQGYQAAIANKTKYADYAKQLLDLINAYRSANGLSQLAYNDTVATAAMHRAAESAYSNWNVTAYENGSKRHIRPNFQKASTIAAYYGISGNYGENYGRFFNTPAAILAGWQGSSTHNALLLGNYTQVGIGVAQASNGDYYWIAIFN